MPEASEETWQHRQVSRTKAIDLVKQTREYVLLTEQRRSNAGRLDVEPLTPDPADRGISKRRFKFMVQSWRKEIVKQVEAADDGQLSTASTQDLPSLQEQIRRDAECE